MRGEEVLNVLVRVLHVVLPLAWAGGVCLCLARYSGLLAAVWVVMQVVVAVVLVYEMNVGAE